MKGKRKKEERSKHTESPIEKERGRERKRNVASPHPVEEEADEKSFRTKGIGEVAGG